MSHLLSVAGHTKQKSTDDEEEEDGKDECNCISLPFLTSTLLSLDNDRHRDQ